MTGKLATVREGGEIEPQLGILLALSQRLAINRRCYGHDSQWSVGILGSPRRKPGSILPRHDHSKVGKALPLLENTGGAARWVLAFPTELVRGLKAHGTTTGMSAGGASG